MMSQNIEQDIIAIISEISGYDAEEITADMNFYEDLEIDSIKAIEITVALEKKFKVSVRDEDVPNITTVRQAVDLVKTMISKK